MENHINLKEFVSSVICDIANGVKEAKDKTKDLGITISPAVEKDHPTIACRGHGPARVELLEFDIALTYIGSSESNARLGVLFGTLGGSAGGKLSDESSIVNRLRFSVPIAFDPQKAPDV